MSWLHGLFFKEEFEPRMWVIVAFITFDVLALVAFIIVSVHFTRKYW